jgi:hypothetical protein
MMIKRRSLWSADWTSRLPIRPGQRVIRALFASTIVAAAVGDCANHGHREEPAQKFPENYRTELLEFLHSYINDPTRIRDAAIADPVLMPLSAVVSSGSGTDTGSTDSGGRRGGRAGRGGGGGGEGGGGLFGGSSSNPFDNGGKRERYVVCVRYNAKDRDGRYTGVKQGIAIFAGGRFDGFNEQPKGACDLAEFKPFPELEKLSR